MRIERLTIRGLLRFTDTVSLDLRELPPGLIAITGENGAGKSTLLEAALAALYRQFLSREGQLFDYASGRDSFLETEVAIDGRGVYRARVNVDGVKRTSDAVLEALQPDGSRVVLNDGKATTFDAAVGDLFPSLDLLKASAFAAQNKAGSFVTLEKRDRKDLFSTLLGLQRYEAMSQTAKQAAAFLEQATGRLAAMRDLLARDTADGLLVELDRLDEDLQARGLASERRQGELKSEIASLEDRLAIVQDQVTAYAAATERIRTLETDLTVRRTERTGVNHRRAGVGTQLATELGNIAEERQRDLADIAKRRAGNEEIRTQGAAIRRAVETLKDCDLELARLHRALDEQRTAANDANLAVLEAKRDRDAIRLAGEELARVRRDAELLTSVPCGGTGDYAACQFLTNAAAAKGRLPALETTATGLAAAREKVDTLDLAALAYRPAMRDLEGKVAAVKDLQARTQQTAKYADALAAADARIDELEQKRAEAEQRAVDRETEARERHHARLVELETQALALDQTLTRLTGEILRAQADLAGSLEGHRQAIAVQEQLRATRRDWDQGTASLATLDAGRQELSRRLIELTEKRAQLDAVRARLGRLETERLEWLLLAKAFSRDGLPVLEIDAAGPTISAYTNELLQVCFGARFTLELITQRASADGKKMIDDFSIRVLDNARGGDSRDVADLSGGEQVIVAEALMNAIGLYVNTTSPMPIRTCWRDETTGALDPENGVRYLQMLRKVHELGGYHHIFFICHNADLAALADAQIRVAGGQAEIVLPPYAADQVAA